jgi:hypothetical protein
VADASVAVQNRVHEDMKLHESISITSTIGPLREVSHKPAAKIVASLDSRCT